MNKRKIVSGMLRAMYEAQKEFGSPCAGKPELYSDGPLPAAQTAWELCRACPLEVFSRCDHYAKYAETNKRIPGVGEPYGVWGGKVYGSDDD